MEEFLGKAAASIAGKEGHSRKGDFQAETGNWTQSWLIGPGV